MELSRQQSKSELSSNDSENYTLRSIQLGFSKRLNCQNRSPLSLISSKLSDRSQLTQSAKKKLLSDSINVTCKPSLKNSIIRMSDSYYQRSQFTINCMGTVTPTNALEFTYSSKQMQFYQLFNQNKDKSIEMFADVHPSRGEKKGCWDQNCPIKAKWLKNIIFYQRQLKNLMILKEKVIFLKRQTVQQIEKDANRSFSENVMAKPKLTLCQFEQNKQNLIQNLKAVLKLYAAFDDEIGYVQGINLIGAGIVLHMKEVNPSFIFLKEVFQYGKLRKLYLNNFQDIKSQIQRFINLSLRKEAPCIYDNFIASNVQPLMFVPYYMSLFSSFVDISYIHILINLFMKDGIQFLHRFFLALLLFMKDQLLEAQDDILYLLGNSSLKDMNIPWDQVIVVAQKLTLN